MTCCVSGPVSQSRLLHWCEVPQGNAIACQFFTHINTIVAFHLYYLPPCNFFLKLKIRF